MLLTDHRPPVLDRRSSVTTAPNQKDPNCKEAATLWLNPQGLLQLGVHLRSNTYMTLAYTAAPSASESQDEASIRQQNRATMPPSPRIAWGKTHGAFSSTCSMGGRLSLPTPVVGGCRRHTVSQALQQSLLETNFVPRMHSLTTP